MSWRRTRQLILFAFDILVSVSCSSAPHTRHVRSPIGPPELSHSAFRPVDLHVQAIVEVHALGHPANLLLRGPLLWVEDDAGDPFIHIVDVVGDTVVRSLGRYGSDSTEFASIVSLSTRNLNDSSIWAFDISLQRLVMIRSQNEKPGIMILAPRKVRLLRAVWLDTATILGVGELSSSRIVRMDASGTPKLITPSPLLGGDSVPSMDREAVSTGIKVCVKPGGGEAAIAFAGAGRIDIVEDSQQQTASAQVPFPTVGDYGVNKLGELHLMFRRRYYTDCSATSNRIYALFSGRLLSAYQKSEDDNGSFIHVFDWYGKLITVFRLDHEMNGISVSGDTVLFLTNYNSDRIYRAAIPRNSGQ